MRKVMGAQKSNLVFQHLLEAIILTTLAMVIGILITETFMPWVNTTYSVDIGINYFDGVTLPVLILFSLGLGLFSGSFPAFALSNFKILDSLKGGFGSTVKGNMARNLLVIFQFTLSIVLIIGTLIVASQINFMKNTSLAFEKENLLVIPVGEQDFPDREDGRMRLETFRNELQNHSNILSISNSRHVPGRWSGSNTFVRPEGWEGDPLRMRYTYHDQQFFDTYGIKMSQGDGFLPDEEGDQRGSVVLNQAAMKAFGWENFENKMIVLGDNKINVVGVINDFNYETLQNEIAPILHFHRAPSNGVHSFITTRINPADMNGVLAFVEEKWAILDEDRPFSYFFVEDDMAAMYQNEDRLLKMVALFSGISIFIGCLGLFGLSAFLIEKRRKEIGIRKVLGASVSQIAFMITHRFNKLIMISFLIAAPASWLLMEQWLTGFAYHVDVQVSVFVITLLLTVLVGWFTVGFKSLQAALADPVNSIKEE